MDPNTPRIQIQDTPQGQSLQVLGAWTAAELSRASVWTALTAQLASLESASQEAPWSLASIEKLDYLGAQVLFRHWGHRIPPQLELQTSQRELLETVAKFTVSPPPRMRLTLSDLLAMAGSRLFTLLDHASGLLRLVGQLLLDLIRLLRRPKQGPWRDLSGHLYQIGATALPITALVGFLIGVVLAYLISQQLKQFGADSFIVNILGISLVRELGPVLAAILIAGRSGSAITAQIGVMRVTEELDAMRVMGIAHGFRLVLPRALALAVVMPLISVWTTLAALAGGMLAASASMGITPGFFIESLPAAVEVSNLVLATAKSVVFGLLIALVGCHFGLRVEPNTESLGKGTTASVVTSITVVILVDALFAVLFKGIGI
ncbi:putative phospholipid ABC transporter permease protein MlaE [Polaromonas vacuolata]|uniref:Putative phospholipid ABC transporter permease protein MlaE n=1 Tax=Polaromonas vacuolata TaxID=37448 RepID=A0A6H2H5U8_9BURK|nr:ABC transporter permease [Polaromonas vacuolata]QJC54876.1 putative phospholipid ABC transporter permease protein MlaE [Polaromonas vacuolata]